MTRSLKSKYLLLALGSGTGLALLLGGFAYYEHRIDSADIARLTYATVEQKLEGDLEARGKSVVNVTGALLVSALVAHNSAAVASIAGRLLEEDDIERVEVTDARGVMLFTASNPQSEPSRNDAALRSAVLDPLVVTNSIPPGIAAPAQRTGDIGHALGARFEVPLELLLDCSVCETGDIGTVDAVLVVGESAEQQRESCAYPQSEQ